MFPAASVAHRALGQLDEQLAAWLVFIVVLQKLPSKSTIPSKFIVVTY